MDGTRRTALVTGASSGIGREITRLLAADGVDLVLVARNRARLTELADALQAEHRVPVRIKATDLSEPNAPARLWRELSDAGIAIDILVNNAGYGVYGAVSDQDPAALEKMLQVNVVALTSLARLALPGMRARRGDASSMSGPSSVTSRVGLAWRLLRQQGLRDVVLEESRARARRKRRKPNAAGARGHRIVVRGASGAGNTRLYKLGRKMTAAAVARAGYAGMKRGSAVVSPGLWNKLIAFAGELPPRRIALEVNRWLLGAHS